MKWIMASAVLVALSGYAVADLNLNVYLENITAFGSKTETAGTDILINIPARSGEKICIVTASFEGDITEHDVYFQWPQSTTTLDTVIAIGDTVFYATDSLNDYNSAVIAANDLLNYQYDDGTWNSITCSVVTFNAGVPRIISKCDEIATKAAAAGNSVEYYGIEGDGNGYKVVVPDTSATYTTQHLVTVPSTAIVGRSKGHGMKVINQNATNAGTINGVTAGYINK